MPVPSELTGLLSFSAYVMPDTLKFDSAEKAIEEIAQYCADNHYTSSLGVRRVIAQQVKWRDEKQREENEFYLWFCVSHRVNEIV